MSIQNTSDFAIEMTDVKKHYTQRQQGAGGLKGLFHPEYKDIPALDGVSFALRPGEIAAYAGPNGAGKSTTFKLLCGMLTPDSGAVRALGVNPLESRIPLMRRTGVLFGGRTELWWDQPVKMSFEWKRAVWDIDDATYSRMLDMAVNELEIEPILNTFARELSLGQRMRAELALMMLHDPELILLDEPTLGLDVLSKQRMIAMLRRINEQRGATILVTSHDMDDLQQLARRVIMINKGKLAFDGEFKALSEQSGMLRRITVTASMQPGVPGAHLIKRDGNRYEFEVDLRQTDMRGVMYALSQCEGVTDIESGRAPIEDVIARLYQSWRGEKEEVS